MENRFQILSLLFAGIAFAILVSLRIAEVIPVLDLRDYQTYYYATKAFLAGENPYDLSVLSAYAGKKIAYAFLYPKLILIPFFPLVQAPYQTSALLCIAWEDSYLNPSSHAFIRQLVKDSGVPIHEVTGETWKIFAVYALVMLTATFVVLRKTKLWTNPSIILLVSIFLYALLPRFKDYSYILLVLPSLVVLRDMVPSRVLQAAFVLAVCLHLTDYQSFFAAVLLLIVMLTRLSNISPSYSLLQRSS